jgi:outer membrane receptor protein involved in Fe transport
MLFPQTSQPEEPRLEPLKSSITIIEKIETEAPAAITSIGDRELRLIPGTNIDDRLRMIPGFSLFRRNPSLTAHPTTQGISLRGIGSTGASRTLVLWDGIPINDPFGGWVYWTRVPPDELQRVEVSRGASTSVFGDRAMGGAIALFTREPERVRLNASYQAGNRGSHDLWGGFSHLWRRLAVTSGVRAYTTDGYYLVPENLRGSVDRKAGVRFVTGNTRLDLLGGANRLFVRLDVLTEDRANGTSLQRNSTNLGTIAANYSHDFGGDSISLLGYHSREEFHSSFSSITNQRNTETITFRQRVPAEGLGGAAMWRRSRSRWSLVAGSDVNRAEGTSTDTLPNGTRRVGGGTLLQYGVFGQATASVGNARLFVGAREHVTGDDQTFFSPNAGFTYGLGRLRARGSVYRSFRAPTLNELYREFRVGNAVTQANAALRPETLFGAEVGLDISGETRRASVTFFRNSLDDLITNVTLSVTPAQTIRQRQNAASALSRGVELEVRQGWRNWRAEASYLFSDGRFANGLRLPQVPRHQGSAQVTYSRGGTLASAGVRAYDFQFEDDRNALDMLHPGFASFHLLVDQKIVRNLAAVAAIENVGNRAYVTGFSGAGIPTLGAPRLWRVGLRWDGSLFGTP